MQHFLTGCKKLVQTAIRSGVLPEQTGSCRSVCSAFKAPCHSRCSPRISYINSSSCQRWCHVYARQFATRRYYSEKCRESSDVQRSAGVIPGEPQETDGDGKRRSSATFSLDVLVSLLRQENAVDICVIKVPEQIKYADYFIVVSGVSARHLRAMALYAIKVYKFLKKEGEPNVKIEGKNTEEWMCIDFGNMVVHFMLPETREMYELEKLWTLRTYDEQLKNIPAEMLPEDFIYDGVEVTTPDK